MRLSKIYQANYGQEGSVLIVALIMLALLSIIGIAVTTTSRLDIRIASNEYVAKQNLYAAEASAMELVQHLDNSGDEIKWMDASSPFWLVKNITCCPVSGGQNMNGLPATPFHSVNDPDFPPELVDINLWQGSSPNLVRPSSFFLNNRGEAIAFHLGVAGGSTVTTGGGQSTVWEYRIYGRSNLYQGTRNDGWSIVEIGFRKVM